MSHWINSPTLIDTESNKAILDLTGNVWDLASATESADSLILMLRRYPDGNKGYEVIVYPVIGEASINGKLTQSNDVNGALEAIE